MLILAVVCSVLLLIVAFIPFYWFWQAYQLIVNRRIEVFVSREVAAASSSVDLDAVIRSVSLIKVFCGVMVIASLVFVQEVSHPMMAMFSNGGSGLIIGVMMLEPTLRMFQKRKFK